MQPERTRRILIRQGPNEVHSLNLGTGRPGSCVLSAFAEFVLVNHELWIKEACKNTTDSELVHLVSDPATVYDLGNNEVESGPRHLIVGWSLFDVHPDLLHCGLQVTVHEAVRYVPTDGSELLPLQNVGVEKSNSEDELLELLGSAPSLPLVRLHVGEGPQQVRPQSLGGLIGDFDSVLEDGDRELGTRHGSQPKSEVIVRVVRVVPGGLKKHLELGKP
mmetsp:Transcript_1694/g.3210  ORF Transcript_1694/g.3210 Transcript_1694/m.3210 type:complete len:219 (+) Transcript_1694:1140-1796(+)